jgi:Short C-terminal domain/Phospholipase_D-nuclease N-terminal
MLVGANYPFLDVVWTIFIFFAWIVWFMLLFRVFADVFRRHDIGGGRKTLWLIFVILLPFLGVFVYLIAESSGMAERDTRDVRASQEQFDTYVKSVAGSGGPAAEIEKAKQLLDNGAITQAEFDSIKARALASA